MDRKERSVAAWILIRTIGSGLAETLLKRFSAQELLFEIKWNQQDAVKRLIEPLKQFLWQLTLPGSRSTLSVNWNLIIDR